MGLQGKLLPPDRGDLQTESQPTGAEAPVGACIGRETGNIVGKRLRLSVDKRESRQPQRDPGVRVPTLR